MSRAAGAPPAAAPLPVAGVRLGTAAAGIAKGQREDLVVLELGARAQTASLFTRNAFCAAPVTVAEAAERYPPHLAGLLDSAPSGA